MRSAETVLAIIHERGTQGLPLGDVYRQLFNPALYLRAYGKISRNAGAMTHGSTNETVDAMSLGKIADIIAKLRQETYRWSPARRIYIEKKRSTQTRPLGIPTWSDKLLQEVIRAILEAYYEPQFEGHSHGFRPNRGCHTALQEIQASWKGTIWFIEGDISRCFDRLDHHVLMSILRERITDNRFLRLLENLLKAGYLEEWRYHATLSGSPQGGVVSPILANIYLDRLDKFVACTLIPASTRGKERGHNPPYARLSSRRIHLRKQGKVEEAKEILKRMRVLPARKMDDPNYRRLRYVRYADDFLLAFTGPKGEAEGIKRQVQTFLEGLKLELCDAKTLITHGRSERARFLGYKIGVRQTDTKLVAVGKAKRRNLNGSIALFVPEDVVKAKIARYVVGGKVMHRPELRNDSVFDIITRYQWEFRGFAEYYALAQGRADGLSRLKWTMERSLTGTLAGKLRTSRKKVYDRYRATIVNRDGTYKGLRAIIERPDKPPLVATWGGVSLARPRTISRVVLNDQPLQLQRERTELVQRLLAETCELCGSTESVEVHHIRKLADLKRCGRRERPQWMQTMAMRRRKTLVVCRRCHHHIHAGRPTAPLDSEHRRAG